MNDGRPVCSVCIANYNGIDLIGPCIASVLAQDRDGTVEIIVHDDASSDGSAALIRERYPTVRLIESETNVGFCVANNRMAALATGRYLLLLNNDATLLPDALGALLDEAARLARPAILTLPQYDADTGALLDIGYLLDPFLNPVPNLDAQRGDVGTVAGACLWIDAALWREIGGFPEWFGSIGEDLYLCCRARLAGHPVRALGVSGFRHCVGASFGGGKVRDGRLRTTYRRRALSERNKTFVMVICQPVPLLSLLLPMHLVLLHIEGFVLALMNSDRLLWSAIYVPLLPQLWIHRLQLCAERRSAQLRRRTSLLRWLGGFVCMPWKLVMLARHGLPDIRHHR